MPLLALSWKFGRTRNSVETLARSCFHFNSRCSSTPARFYNCYGNPENVLNFLSICCRLHKYKDCSYTIITCGRVISYILHGLSSFERSHKVVHLWRSQDYLRPIWEIFKVYMKWKLSSSYLKELAWNDKGTPSIVFLHRSSFLR